MCARPHCLEVSLQHHGGRVPTESRKASGFGPDGCSCDVDRRCRVGSYHGEREGLTEFVHERIRGLEIGRVDIPCRTLFVLIFINRSRNVTIDRFATSGGNVRVVGQPHPHDGVLPLVDQLPRDAPVIVRYHQPFGRACHVGHDKADARTQLSTSMRDRLLSWLDDRKPSFRSRPEHPICRTSAIAGMPARKRTVTKPSKRRYPRRLGVGSRLRLPDQPVGRYGPHHVTHPSPDPG